MLQLTLADLVPPFNEAPDETHRTCRKCLKRKRLEQFQKHRACVRGRTHTCRACGVKLARRISARNPERCYRTGLRSRLRRDYGLEIAQYDAMMERQGGVCAICRKLNGKRRMAVDHDHKTGKIRGLLCGHCNRAIGLFLEDADRIREAARYVERGGAAP